jgi:TolB protein
MRVKEWIRTPFAAWGTLSLVLVLGCGDEMIAPLPSLSIQPAPTNSGDRQTDTVGGTLANPLRVLVRRGDKPAPRVAVYWQTSQGYVSADSTKTDASGIASVTWTLDTRAGGKSVDAILPAQPGSPDTLGLRVSFTALANPGAPSQLHFSVPPSNTFAGRPLFAAVRVDALDRFGNVATDFIGSVTVALGPGPVGGTLSGTTTVAAVAGVATFADLRVDQVGVGYSLTASANGLNGDTSAAFDVVSPGTGRIAFWSDRDGDAEIYSMNADGSSLVRLTSDTATDRGPTWSPDANKIAFSRGTHVYVMNADGSGVVRLTSDTATDQGPAWSPDGTKIAFNRGTQIYVMNADGSGVTVLTTGSNAAWSRDGTRIAGSRLFPPPPGCRIPVPRGGYRPCPPVSRIIVMNADASGVLPLTNGREPAWSRDGKIAFTNGSEILVMNADGSGIIRLTDNAANDARPAWSP